jgi:CheY-like chemotaxis protein
MDSRASVLMVEDDDDIRRATCDFLSSAGYECLEAANGREALALLPDLVRPAVVLLDIMMPVMDGFEFLTELARSGQTTDLSVVIVSASPSLCEGNDVTEGVPIVAKPVSPSHLLDLVRTRVAEPSEQHVRRSSVRPASF